MIGVKSISKELQFMLSGDRVVTMHGYNNMDFNRINTSSNLL